MPVRLGYAIFTVEDVPAALRFFTDAFDMPTRFLTPEGDYGELETGQTTLAFVGNDLAHNNLDDAGGFSELDASAPPLPTSVTLVTEELDEAVDAAIAHGASMYVKPLDKPWGQRVAYLRSPSGILIELATPVPDATT